MRRTADEVRRHLPVARCVEDLLDARLPAQLVSADLVPRRRECEERVHVRELTPSGAWGIVQARVS